MAAMLSPEGLKTFVSHSLNSLRHQTRKLEFRGANSIVFDQHSRRVTKVHIGPENKHEICNRGETRIRYIYTQTKRDGHLFVKIFCQRMLQRSDALRND